MYPNLIICYDTQNCHTIVLDHEQIILYFETFVYAMNFILKFYIIKNFLFFFFYIVVNCHEVMIFTCLRNQVGYCN